MYAINAPPLWMCWLPLYRARLTDVESAADACHAMATEAGLRFLPLARLGRTKLGVAPAFVPFQILWLLAFGLLAYFTVAGHLGKSLSIAGSVWVGLVLLLAL